LPAFGYNYGVDYKPEIRMKKIALAIALVCTTVNAFGQKNEMRTTTTMPKVETTKRGFYVGMDYINLTDAQIKLTSTNKTDNSATFSFDEKATTHMGIAGLRLGYSQTPISGFGFNAGLRMLETFNRSEYGDAKIQIFIPEGNLEYAINQYLVPYIGVNFSVWTGSSDLNVYRPGAGLQTGIGFQFNRSLVLTAGYTLLSQTMEDEDSDSSSKGQILLGGFSSNLTYTF
jgi:hypothetical protein